MGNPFKDEEPMSVFKETPLDQKQTTSPQEDTKQQEFSKFPKWDLLPPFKLINRGKKG